MGGPPAAQPQALAHLGARQRPHHRQQIEVANAGQIREELLSVINRGATELIVDMAATVACDHAGADAVSRAYQRAAASGTQLRLVVPAQIVRRVLSIDGLDRLIPVYPSLEAATAAAAPAAVNALVPSPAETAGAGPAASRRPARAMRPQGPAGPRRGPGTAAITQAVLRRLIDALDDGVALADDDGALALANRRLEQMFGYERGELLARPVESLIPGDLRPAHRSHRAAYAQAPQARPMGAGARLVGLRKDGVTLPVEVSLSPVPTATGHLTLAVVRDVTQARQRDDLVDLARAAVAAEQAHRSQDLLDRVINSLFHVGLSLQAAIGLPHHTARQRIAQALQHLDDTIHEIRDHMFTTSGELARPGPAPPTGSH
jgi:anti-anti-sigma factor